ncbi:uncharacterized protein WM277_000472 isoform 2-T3 [Molossus nigricans]
MTPRRRVISTAQASRTSLMGTPSPFHLGLSAALQAAPPPVTLRISALLRHSQMSSPRAVSLLPALHPRPSAPSAERRVLRSRPRVSPGLSPVPTSPEALQRVTRMLSLFLPASRLLPDTLLQKLAGFSAGRTADHLPQPDTSSECRSVPTPAEPQPRRPAGICTPAPRITTSSLAPHYFGITHPASPTLRSQES